MYLSFLNYFALFLLFFITISFFYAIIGLCDIPYKIARKRDHPQQDAIQIAGWVSLFTLHVIWPFIWIWSTLYRKDRGWGFQQSEVLESKDNRALGEQLSTLQNRFDQLEQTISGITVGKSTMHNHDGDI